ncbi:MAG: flagellar biosynthesis protein FlhF [Myxococcota bacterium]
MHIKRFEGPSIQAVLAEVRAELGEDALILSTRTIRKGRGAFGLMARDRVEVQAALERKAGGERPQKSDLEPGDWGKDRQASQVASSTMQTAAPVAQETASAQLLETVGRLQAEVARLGGRADFEEEMRSEMRGLRAALQSALSGSSSPTAKGAPAVSAMIRAGLDWNHAESIARSWAGEEGGGQTGNRSNSIEEVLARRIERHVAPPRTDIGDRLRILVGAPGVGKTTTLAKLAVRNEEGERDVAFASLDHFRIGATAQLREYASLVDAPFSEVRGVEELPGLLDRYRGSSVLVDTAGRSGVDGPLLGSLTELRQKLGRALSVDLVLDATAKRSVHRMQVERFASLAPDRVLITKTDECDSLAEIANLALDEDCAPIAWLGTGQRVPEDLEIADARVLARAVLERAA